MKGASLVVVGSGIKFVSHLTTEAKAYIRKSEKVLFLLNEPAMKDWILANNPNAESLDPLYFKHKLRIDCYREITAYILASLRDGLRLCVVMYGHPTVFAKPALDAAVQAKKQGVTVKILPGISAEDCLYADLMINPGSCGCLSFEATDFLIHRRRIDPRSHLILWQVGVIGALGRPNSHDNKSGIVVLAKYLNQYYSLEHGVFLYEAAQYPHFEPKISELSLRQLESFEVPRIATMYIPPTENAPCDRAMLKVLGISTSELK